MNTIDGDLAEVRLTDDEIATHTYMAVEGPMFTVGDVERILAARVEQARAGETALREAAWDEGWNAAVDSDGYPGDVNPYRADTTRSAQ